VNRKPEEANSNTTATALLLEDFLPYRLSVAADAVSRFITREYLAKWGLGMAEWRLLAAVGRFGVLSPTTAWERTAMDKVKVSRASASLVSSGLLRQSLDPADGRGRLLRLTRRGSALYEDIAPAGKEIEETLMLGLSRTEWRALHRALGRLSEHTRSLMDGADEGGSD
jgi:DNA-binding MarR family transcriptional regulator